ncbi:trehalose-phosphatase [Microlunatus spumicola]|uniref:Trehalose 6-phosphate phosphatase n=1 Tax=Microlunatus spumicola TaxID=81499 RepID=A0ABP6X4X8_9ACTN
MTSDALAQTRLQAVLEHPGETLVGIDFDGTLAPIVADPEQAHADPRAVAALARLGNLLGTVAIVTGRPARTAVRLGGFRGVPGLGHLVVLGQYGVERWDAATDEFVIPPDPGQVAALEQEIPPLLDRLGQGAAHVEHKGRAVVVHTRQLPDPDASYAALSGPLNDLAERHEMVVEPGKNVLEIRSPGIDKGVALRAIVEETGARQVVFVGDDLGDLPAFRLVEQLRREGRGGLLVCSASHEEDALSVLADVVVEGPSGVATWLEQLADALETRRDAR